MSAGIGSRSAARGGGSPAPAPRRTGGPRRGRDVVVGRLVRLRVVDAGPADLAAVERQFGPTVPASGGSADLTLRYVDRIVDTETVRYLGPGEHGFTSSGLFVLQGRFRRPVRVRLPLTADAVPEVVCEHGVGRVPHLVALVNLAVLRAGGLALHASAFELDGAGVVATGWSKGGKTEALLAARRRGARAVADEWSHLHPDGTVTGIREPVRLWDWHLDQLHDLRASLPASDRHRLTGLRLAHRAALRCGASPRLVTTIDRHRHVDAPLELVGGGDPAGCAPVTGVLLMTSADQTTCTVHDVAAGEVADRMAGSLAYERLPLAGLLAAHRYAFPDAATTSIDDVYRQERSRLHELLDGTPAVEIRHPHHVDLEELAGVIAAAARRWT